MTRAVTRAASESVLEAVKTDGGLLPADVLQRIASTGKDVPGLAPSDFHIEGTETIAEAITRSWNRLLGVWAAFRTERAKLPREHDATTLTRNKWLLPLFSELGYGRLTKQPKGALLLGEQVFDISHAYHHSPIHMVGAGVDLERRHASAAGAKQASPHGLVQDFLNKSDAHLWAFVTNGLRLRILRDHRSLTRLAYVELDLEAIFEGELFHAFRLVWLLCHQSRVEADKPEECWLERWHALAQADGISALEKLRDGVERAIEALGRGFRRHPDNTELAELLTSGRLDKQDYYRELLRLAYRLIFLFVTEDRDVLLEPDRKADGTLDASVARARRTYERFYSTRRLRDLARRRRGSSHGDLWESLRVVMELVSGEPEVEEKRRTLALPALGSFLWARSSIEHLATAKIANEDLLAAVLALSTTEDARRQRFPVNWKSLGADELGSVYESLLELHPEITPGAPFFELRTAAGHERKTTGSYYTPSSLVECLLDTALEPVVDEAIEGKSGPEARDAILALTVCDPACGSGHFLIAAAHRLAKRVAMIDADYDEPSPAEKRRALREVVSRCIYGVDLNPMAAELCKVNLWLEAVEPGRPLSFLDSHIQVGNAVVGATAILLEDPLPDAAFSTLEGDDAEVATRLRARNKRERTGGQTSLFGRLADAFAAASRETARDVAEVDRLPDTTASDVRRKETLWESHLASPEFRHARAVADTWTAAFFWNKQPGPLEDAAPTTGALAQLRKNASANQAMQDEAARLREHYRFFHWHLMFPTVFADEGFHVMLGNPPWDTLSPDAKEFFSAYDPRVRESAKEEQTRLIDDLTLDPMIAHRWAEYRRDLYALVLFLKSSGRFTLYAEGNLGKGDFNIYRMFVEWALRSVRPRGIAAQIIPEGFYSGANCMAIRKHLFDGYELLALLGFENHGGVWFEGIDTRSKFALYAARQGGTTRMFPAAFLIRDHAGLAASRSDRLLAIPVTLVEEFSPDALAVMEFTSQRDIDIARKMYARHPKFGDEAAGTPHRTYMAEVHMGNDRELFEPNPPGLPVYEGRMVSQYDHRAKGYRSGRGRTAIWDELPFSDATKSIQPQWFVREERVPDKCRARVAQYRVGFCDVASPTNERTLVAALLPPETISGHKVPTITFTEDVAEWFTAVWLGVANSFAIDFVARKKVSLAMSYTVLDSLPFPRPDRRLPWVRAIASRVSALSCTSHEMAIYWNAMAGLGFVTPARSGVVPGERDPERRLVLRAEIDAIVAHHVYGLTVEEMDFILATFPTTARYEQKKYGDFRSRRLILDSMRTLVLGGPSAP